MAAALGLARKGFPSIVLEQAPELGEIGAGIQIGPNAFHAFDYLGIGDAARAKAVYIDHLVLMDAMKDERIAAIPLNEPFRKRFKTRMPSSIAPTFIWCCWKPAEPTI